tara:strand:+ start:1072 stop:1458 length:387 start_codon:yes stop_codon:yes gene_type:complete
MKYGYQKTMDLSFENVNEKLRKSLMEVGFGIITEIDVQSTFKEKLDIDYERFQILGACNPELANKALNIEREVGLLLPCNVIFWENQDSSVTVSSIDAEIQLGVTDDERLSRLGREVNELLAQAIDSI